MNFYSASTCRYKRAQVLPLLKKTATVMLFIASKLQADFQSVNRVQDH